MQQNSRTSIFPLLSSLSFGAVALTQPLMAYMQHLSGCSIYAAPLVQQHFGSSIHAAAFTL